MATIILARRSNRICPYHLQTTLVARDDRLQFSNKSRAIGET
jgi:hypothetical protein